MKGFEIMWNSYANPIVQPLILTMTQTFKTGPGYTLEEIAKYISQKRNQTSVFKFIKNKIVELWESTSE